MINHQINEEGCFWCKVKPFKKMRPKQLHPSSKFKVRYFLRIMEKEVLNLQGYLEFNIIDEHLGDIVVL